MKIHEILIENIFTTDYHKVMDAVAELYNSHYDINIWENGEAHDDAAKVLLKVHPTEEELEYIIKTGNLPERFLDLDFPINDDLMYGVQSGQTIDEAAEGPEGAEQRMLDRMGKRFGLPPGSSQEQVQAAQQAHLDKTDPAAAAQYKKNMANIDAGGTHADNAPVKLAPKPAAAKPEADPDAAGGQAAAKAGKSPIAIMLAQPTIGKNQAMLDVIAPTVGLPTGSSAADILAADAARNAKAGNKYAAPKAPAATPAPAAAPAAESIGGGVDAKGRTQAQWMKLVKQKFPDAKIQQAKMIDGPCRAVLPNGKTLSWNKVTDAVVGEEPASRALCTSGKPDSALGASQLSSCKSQGYRSRDGGKSHKVGGDRIKVRGKKIKGKKYGGPLPDWS